jgi:hypothetical protein
MNPSVEYGFVVLSAAPVDVLSLVVPVPKKHY